MNKIQIILLALCAIGAIVALLAANGYKLVPTYKVVYTPANSRHPLLDVQHYFVLGHPSRNVRVSDLRD